MSAALDAIIGQSRAIIELRELIRAVARSKLAVMIEGPTGAGKELVAAAVHEESGRRGQFVPFNVCAIGETMFEDAVFGHVRGAFTGAIGDSPGFLREANGGTAFLDEISSLQPLLQSKLLRAIETGEFRPVGARQNVRSDFRVVAATNERTAALVADGRLRRDLAHRLSGVVIPVPALAERLEDIPLLVRHFLAHLGPAAHVGEDTLAALAAHSWPGNVRELRNVVECATALGGLTLTTVCALTRGDDRASGATARRNALRATLDAHAWNARSTARSLGVHRATVYRWMRESGLDAP